MKKLRVGTRGSKLALKQTEIIIEKIKKTYPDLEFEVVTIKTTGDKILDVSLSKIGGKGLFIKEIEEALLHKKIDMAIHSLKDMPADVHQELILAAYSEREDASDCLISRGNITLERLPKGAIIGTSSLRRVCQLKALRPDIEIKPLRGNILTRINKLDEGEFDAIVLATAGLKRLGLEDRIAQRFKVNEFIPAVCQGIICVETRKDDKELFDLLKVVDNKASRVAAICERAFLKQLNGNCQVPLGAHCQINEDELYINGILGDQESGIIHKDFRNGTVDQAEQMGYSLGIAVKNK